MNHLTKDALLEQAAGYIRSKEYQKALDILVPYLQENHQSEQAWFLISFALQDTDKKVYALEKVLKINPTNTRAKDRIIKIQNIHALEKNDGGTGFQQSKIDHKPRTRSWPWYTYLVAFLIVLLIGFITIFKIFPTISSGKTQLLPEVLEESPTSTLPNTYKETDLPSQLPSITPTVETTPSTTPIIIPTNPPRDFDPPQGTLAMQMDDIQNQVSTIRELGILADNPRYLIPQTEVYIIVSKIFRDNYDREEIQDQAIVLQSLGLINPTYDLYSHMMTSFDEGIGGFYIPLTDELFVVGKDFSPTEKLIYAHEYNHTLIDQHFNLGDTGFYPLCIDEPDRCAAITALVEGDATFLMYRWLEAYASEEDIAVIQEAQFSPIDEIITNRSYPPSYQVRDTYFRYADGQAFVEFLFKKGGWALVNKAYQELPDTTEKILHPEKYLSQESPVNVELKSLRDILDDTWEYKGAGTLGELKTEMILGYNENYLIQIDQNKAAKAAAGWGGDQYQIFYQNSTNQTLMVIMWEWDTLDDRNEFWEAISEYLNLRYLGKQIQETDDTCWVKIIDHFSCIYKWNNKILWLTAPSMSLISQIKAEYPGFR